jgi:hypothetical protein
VLRLVDHVTRVVLDEQSHVTRNAAGERAGKIGLRRCPCLRPGVGRKHALGVPAQLGIDSLLLGSADHPPRGQTKSPERDAREDGEQDRQAQAKRRDHQDDPAGLRNR